MPLVDPVTSAVLPVKSIAMVFCFRSEWMSQS